MRYAERIQALGRQPLALVDTYGCQQNEADSEEIRGYIELMGYGFTDSEAEADLIVVNTCAIREHAEMRVLGNVGALVHAKAKNPNLLVAVCGCMVQQPHMAEKLRKSFRVVDLVFGPHELWRFPELYKQARDTGKRVFDAPPSEGVVAEGLPVRRSGKVKAWLSIMYGCNNFCTYCIVPYVRGRERSRRFDDVVAEAQAARRGRVQGHHAARPERKQLRQGSGRGARLRRPHPRHQRHPRRLPHPLHDQPPARRHGKALPHHGRVREVRQAHPPARAERLRQGPARDEPPLQSREIPRRSTPGTRIDARSSYLLRILSSASPVRRRPDFEDTMSLIEEVRYDAMFTFIFSAREGTKAAAMPDPVSRDEKQRWFDRLVERANEISAEKHRAYIGTRQRVLVDGVTGKAPYNLSARTNGGRLVHMSGDEGLVGKFVYADITDGNTWALYGTPVKED